MCPLDASVHFGIRSLAQHKLSSADFSVHRGSSCSYRRSGVVLPLTRYLFGRSACVLISLHSASILSTFPSLFSAHAGSDSVALRVPIHFTRTVPDAVPANLSLTLTTPVVYSVSHGRTKPTAPVPNLFRSHFPITMRCTGAALVGFFRLSAYFTAPPR